MTKRHIPQVNNMQQKEETYKRLIGNLKRALKSHYYFEAIFVEYALIEDRSNSILFHLGFYEKREDYCKYIKKNDILNLVPKINEEKNRKTIKLSDLTGKLDVIEAYLKVHYFDNENKTIIEYIKKKDSLFESNAVDIDEILRRINIWKEIRNELTHASANKIYSMLYEKLIFCANEGEEIFREFDNISREIKKLKLRKVLNLS